MDPESKVDDPLSSLEATDAFLLSEKRYVEEGLRKGVETFMNRLIVHIEHNKTILIEADITRIFSAYKVIYQANDELLKTLMTARMNRKVELRDVLGDIMNKWAPYLKVYLDYTLKKQQNIQYLEKLAKSNKKFQEFLKINESCVQRTLKSFLEQPIIRLPQYLQEIGNIYVAWDREDASDNNRGKKELFASIVNIKKVTDEISEKIKNKKARKLVAHLQKRVFNDKVVLIASHRFVVTHGLLKVINKKSLQDQRLVLCNDILLFVKPMKNPSAKALIQVFPLIGMKTIETPEIPKKLEKKALYAFGIQALLTNSIVNITVVCEDYKEKENWIEIIKDTVDEEEHSLHPCNPIDLEKRLRKEKCSKEGMAETLRVTDAARVKEIDEWKKWKAAGSQTQRRRLTNLKVPPKLQGQPQPPSMPSYQSAHNIYSPPPSQQSPYAGASSSSSGAPQSPPKPQRPPPSFSSNNVFNAKSQSQSPYQAPPSQSPPSFSGMANSYNRPPPSAAQAQAQLNSRPSMPKPPSFGSAPAPPSFGAAPSPPPSSSGGAGRGMAMGMAMGGGGGPPPPPPGAGAGSPRRPPGNNKRAGFLGAISSFNKDSQLKQVDSQDFGAQGHEQVDNLLVDTLANYRQFVMDDDENDNDSEENWD